MKKGWFIKLTEMDWPMEEEDRICFLAIMGDRTKWCEENFTGKWELKTSKYRMHTKGQDVVCLYLLVEDHADVTLVRLGNPFPNEIRAAIL